MTTDNDEDTATTQALPNDVESLLLTLMPERNHEALRTGAATEWIIDIEEVGKTSRHGRRVDVSACSKAASASCTRPLTIR